MGGGLLYWNKRNLLIKYDFDVTFSACHCGGTSKTFVIRSFSCKKRFLTHGLAQYKAKNPYASKLILDFWPKGGKHMETDYQIGRLLGQLQKERERQWGPRAATNRKLSRGLCSEAALSKIQKGLISPGKMLADALFSRLGTSLGQYGTAYEYEEYALWEKRQEILRLIRKEDCRQAERKLREYTFPEGSNDTVLHQQFIAWGWLMLEKRQGALRAEFAERVLAALRMTAPDLMPEDFGKYLYGETELLLMALYAGALYKTGQKEEGLWLSEKLVEYADVHLMDSDIRVFIYPRLELLFARMLQAEGCYGGYASCSRAVELLRGNHKLFYAEGLLEAWLAAWEHGGCEETGVDAGCAGLYRETLEVMCQLRGKYGSEADKDLFLMEHVEGSGMLMWHWMLALRKELGMTQDELCEGICERETISRIENRKVAPRARVYQMIMKRMGRKAIRYYPELCSDMLRHHNLRKEVVLAIEARDFQAAEEALCVLEQELDTGVPVNRQLMLQYHTLIDFYAGRITQEERMERLVEALHITLPQGCSLVKWPLWKKEAVLLNNIANALEDQGDRDRAMQILSDVLDSFQNNPVAVEDNLAGYLLTLDNYVKVLGRSGRHEEALEACKEGLEYSYLSGRGYSLVDFLYAKAWNLEQIEKKEAIEKTCLTCLKQAFAIARFMGFRYMEKHIESHCHSVWKIDIRTNKPEDKN